jgi:hypothetical protein
MAYDLIARVAALAAINSIRGSSIDLFANITTRTFETTVTAVATGGYTVAGIGSGTYVSDSLATAALAAAHPNLCKKSVDGRYWRLAPTNGTITVDQAGALGDAAGLGAVNDQAAIQAALNYAAAMGIRNVSFPQREYSVWATTRTSTFWTAHVGDGHGLVIPALAVGDIVLRGTGRHTRIGFYNKNGGSFQTNYQTIAADGLPWRGSGLYVVSPTTDPGIAYRPAITLENIWLDGGTTANGNTNWSNPATDVPTGWDISHKGIFIDPDRYSGDLTLRNTKITGFRGELIYASNLRESRINIEGRLDLGETNGQAINPAGGGLHCHGYVVAWNCNVAIEGWMGMGNLRGEFHNILRASTITGGVIDNSGSGNGFKPQRLTESPYTDKLSMFNLDILITSAQQTLFLGSFLRGRVVAVDTTIAIGANETSGPFKLGVIDSDLEIISVADKANLPVALSLAGGGVAGSKQIRDCRFRLTLKQSRDALDAGYQITDGVVYSGSIGENVAVEQSSGASKRGNSCSAALPDYYPIFRANNFGTWSDYSTTVQNVATTPAIIPRGDRMALTGGGATNSVTTITLPTTGIGDGYELTLYNNTGPSGNWYFAIDRSGGGARLPARRLVGGDDAIKLKFDANSALWREVVPPKPISLATTPTLPALAANALSAVQTVTVYGAEVGMDVRIQALFPNTALEIVNPMVSAANTVAFRVRELSGGAYAGGTYTINIAVKWRRTWLS